MPVDIFSDTVEITNPGWFIEGQSPSEHISGADSSSLSRNELLVTTLHKSRDIEAYGTGIPRIRDACAEAGITFEYERVPVGTRFVFHRPDPFGAAGNGRQRLSPNEQRILDHLVSVGLSTTAEVSRALDIPARTVRSAMRRLVDAGMVESLGSDRNRAYRAV